MVVCAFLNSGQEEQYKNALVLYCKLTITTLTIVVTTTTNTTQSRFKNFLGPRHNPITLNVT